MLRAKCESLVIESLSVANVVHFFQLALLHDSAQLKMKSMNFLSKNWTEVERTAHWNDFMKNPRHKYAVEELNAFREL